MTSSVKIPWVLAVAAALALGWGLLWAGYFSESPGDTEGEAPFYADFDLTAHTGMFMTEEDFAGQWKLIFFGFANCPDVCPTTLSEVAAVMDGLGPDKEKVQPLFITVDPERDTPEVLANFVPRFDAGIIGLTGTPEQTARTAENFYIYYEKVEEAAAPGDYTMGHSSQLFLFGPDGGYVTSWQYGTPAEEILADLRERISS
ncbi:SCO family protein [Tranquillimonas alkanivorans]|nr:SCO family protein [Tranquillimonas alkanivorans]